MTDINAKLSGQFRIGGEIPINRLGFSAMRITGPGVWGEPEITRRPSTCCDASPSFA